MKNNTKELKDLLKKTLSAIPEDFAFNDVKHHVKIALSRLEAVEKNRDVREKSYQNRKLKEQEKKKMFFNPREVLFSIDELIEAEQQKLKNIQSRKNTGFEQEKNNDEDVQFLG